MLRTIHTATYDKGYCDRMVALDRNVSIKIWIILENYFKNVSPNDKKLYKL